MEDYIGRRCVVVDSFSFFRGDKGTIDFFDGEYYYVVLDGEVESLAFEKNALLIEGDERFSEAECVLKPDVKEETIKNTIKKPIEEQKRTAEVEVDLPDRIRDSHLKELGYESDRFAKISCKIVTKKELIDAINMAFPEDESTVATIMTSIKDDGDKSQIVNLARILDI